MYGLLMHVVVLFVGVLDPDFSDCCVYIPWGKVLRAVNLTSVAKNSINTKKF